MYEYSIIPLAGLKSFMQILDAISTLHGPVFPFHLYVM